MTLSGCFTVLTVNLASYLETPRGLLTSLDCPLINRNVPSSENITFLQSVDVQLLNLLQNCSLFFFILALRSGFFAARLHWRPRSFWSRCWIVRIETFSSSSGCFFFFKSCCQHRVSKNFTLQEGISPPGCFHFASSALSSSWNCTFRKWPGCLY